jgi:hypothetical protein
MRSVGLGMRIGNLYGENGENGDFCPVIFLFAPYDEDIDHLLLIFLPKSLCRASLAKERLAPFFDTDNKKHRYFLSVFFAICI